jgi:hypothetical protein
MRLSLVLLVSWLFTLTAYAQTYTWTGTNSGLWNDAGNWTGGVPLSGIDTSLTFNNGVNLAMTQNITTSPTAMVLNRMSFLSSAGSFSIAGAPLEFRTDSSANLPRIENTSAGSRLVTITPNVLLTNTLTHVNNGSGNPVTRFDGTVSGPGGVILNSGYMLFTGNVTYLGNTVVNNSPSFGIIDITPTATFNSPGTITFMNGFSALEMQGTIGPGGLLTMGDLPGSGNLDQRPWLNGFGGTIQRNVEFRAVRVNVGVSSSLTIQGNLTTTPTTGINNPTRIFGGPFNITGNLNANANINLQANSAMNVDGTVTITNSTLSAPPTSSFGGSSTTVNLTSTGGFSSRFYLGITVAKNFVSTAAGGSNSISTVNQGGPGTVQGSVQATGTLELDGSSGNTLTVTGPITQTSGSLVIRGVVTANSLTTIQSGASFFMGAATFNGPGAVSVLSGGQMQVDNFGIMNKTVTSAGTLVGNGGTYGGPVTTLAGSVIFGVSASTLTFSNTFTVNGSTSLRQAGNDGPVVVQGLTTLNSTLNVVSGNRFTANGGIAVGSGGVLRVNQPTNGITGNTIVQSGGRMTGVGQLNGSLLNTVRVLPGGILSPGNSPGQITIGGGLELLGTLEVEISNGLGGPNTTSNGGFDTVRVVPPPNDPNPTDTIIRIADVVVRLLTGNTSQTAFQQDNFWVSSRRWAVVNNTNGLVRVVDPVGNPVALPAAANFNLLSPDGQTTIDPYLSYPNSSFTFDVVISGQASRLDLVWTPVPEPTTLLAPLALLSLAWRCRHRWRARRGSISTQ